MATSFGGLGSLGIEYGIELCPDGSQASPWDGSCGVQTPTSAAYCPAGYHLNVSSGLCDSDDPTKPSVGATGTQAGRIEGFLEKIFGSGSSTPTTTNPAGSSPCSAGQVHIVGDNGQPQCVSQAEWATIKAKRTASGAPPVATKPISPTPGTVEDSADVTGLIVLGLLVAGGGYFWWRKRGRMVANAALCEMDEVC